jgi:hypothetical protein
MANKKQYSLSTSILSSLVSLILGISIFILLKLFVKLIIYYIKRQRSPDMNMEIEQESDTPDTALHPLAVCTRCSASTTIETMPRRAVSDMDRDITLQNANCEDLRDLEAAIPRIHR